MCDDYVASRYGSRRNAVQLNVVAALLAVACAGHLAAADVMSFQGIGDLTGGSYESRAQAISADGLVVVGGSRGTSNQPARWTAAEGLVGIPRPSGGGNTAWAASADGGIIFGGGADYGFGGEAFRWTESTGTVGLGCLPDYTGSTVRGASTDGSVAAGWSYSSTLDRWQPFRWTQETGMVGLGYPEGDQTGSANAVSGDGSTIVGDSCPDFSSTRLQAWRWTETGGYQQLGHLPGEEGEQHRALAVSYDGSMVAGFVGPDSETGIIQAWRWTEANGFEILPDFENGIQALARGMTPDGSVIVGAGSVHVEGNQWTSVAVIWDDVHGVRNLQEMLLDAGVQDVADWYGMEAAAISADGMTIVGTGYNPDGHREGWVATIPEPTSLALLLFAGLVALRTRARSS